MMRMIVLILLIALARLPAEGTTYYSRTSGTNWSVPGTWSTSGYGGGAAASAPGASDTVKIGDTYTVVLNANSSCAQLDIGQGASGVLQYSSGGAYSLTVSGNVTVNIGGTIIYSANFSRTHTLSIGGNFTNNGTVNLYYDSNDLVNITFSTSTTSTVSGTGTWTLSTVTIGKTTSAGIVDVQVSAFESAIVTLTATTGTYIHNNTGSYSVNSSVSTDFTIAQDMVFKILQGTMTFSPNTTKTYLNGSLYVAGGNVKIGTTLGTNGLRFDKTGTNIPYLEISSGTLTVYGGITYNAGASSDPFSFNMTGGTLLLNSGLTGTSSEVFFVTDVATSIFAMSGGTITIQSHNSSGGSNSADWTVCGGSGTVTSTGGTVEFGNASTVTGTTFDFTPFPNVEQPNFKVTGGAAAAISLKTSKGSSANFMLLSLTIDANKTFDITSISGSAGNTKMMTITSTSDGSSSFSNSGTFTPRSGRVVFAGTSTQSVGGSSTTSFYDLKINNVSGVILSKAVNVTDSLLMTSGVLTTTSTNILTCTSSAFANIGSSTSYVDGPMVHTLASASAKALYFPVGKSGDYRPTILTPTHSSASSVTYRCEVVNSAAAALAYTLPGSLSSVSYMRYWLFTRAAVANFTSATIQLYYGSNDNITDSSSLRVAQGNGAVWANHGGTGTANGTGSITSSSFAFFNTVFTLGNAAGSGSLPVNLISFSAKNISGRTSLDWTTSSEINNDYFSVERSPDGINFSEIDRIRGAGNSTTLKEYHADDPDPLHGISYYRLRQTDFDGTTNYSLIRKVLFDDRTGHVYVLSEGASKGELNMLFSGMKNQRVNISLLGISGSIIRSSNVLLSTDYENIDLEIPPLPPAVYLLHFESPAFTETKKIYITQ